MIAIAILAAAAAWFIGLLVDVNFMDLGFSSLFLILTMGWFVLKSIEHNTK